MNASYPAQAPTTAKNAINAEDNLPAGNGFAQPPLNTEGSEEPVSNDPAQHPALPPFVQHDAVNAAVNPPVGNEDIIVGGVASAVDTMVRMTVAAGGTKQRPWAFQPQYAVSSALTWPK